MDEADRRHREEERKRRENIIDQRKEGHLNGFTRTILEVRWERSPKPFVEVIVKDCVDEKAYYERFDYIDDAIPVIKYCCHIYHVEQIHVEENGIGMPIFDILAKEIENVDIVPLKYTRLKLT